MNGITVHEVSVPYDNRMGAGARIRAFFEFALRAGPRTVGIEPDVLFATSTPLTIALPAAYAKARTRVPLVFEVRDLWPTVPIAIGVIKNPVSKVAARWLERFAYQQADRIIALSPEMVQEIDRLGVHGKEIVMVPNGCDLDLFSSPGKKSVFTSAKYGNRKICLYAGTIGRVNGVSYLVDVAAELKSLAPDILILIVGDGMEVELVRSYARKSGVLNESLYLQESMPKRCIANLFQACSIAFSTFVDLPEMSANSANKFFDALAAGRPVAINYGGWQADLIARHGLGLVLPTDSPRTAARMLVEFLSDRKTVVESGRSARMLAEREFCRDELSAKVLDVIHSVVTTGGAVGAE